MSKYFFEPYERSAGNAEVESDLSFYATKADLKEETGNNIPKLAAEIDLAILKTKLDKLDVDKIKVTTYANLGHSEISASTSALTSASASALQKKFFSCEVFIFAFRSFL